MRFLRIHGAFPLLRKELVERANQWRTYVIRSAFALLFSGAFLLMIYGDVGLVRGDLYRMLGRGRQFFQFIVVGEFIGIFAFVPGLLCGVIAQEKERRSLGLLFVTDLRPGEILLQKFAGGLLPVMSLLLVSLPLLAIAYAFGGIPVRDLVGGAYILLLTSLQVAAIALCMSSFCRTSVSAFIATYVCGLLLYFGPIMTLGVGVELFHIRWLRAIVPRREERLLLLFPPYVFFELFSSWRRASSFRQLFLSSLPILGSIVVFLFGARWFLVRRAFSCGRNAVMLVWDRIDAIMEWMNALVNDVVLVPDHDSLPESEPVAWLAVHKRALGKVRYLFRVFVCLEVPTAFMAFLAVFTYGRRRGDNEALGAIQAVVWGLAVLAITVYCANLFAGERWRNTLDVLLTTPIRGRDIILQKMKGTRRLLAVLAIPILTVVLFEAWWEWPGANEGKEIAHGWSYLALSCLWLVLFFLLLSWVSLWVGLRTKGRFKTAMVALAVIGAWFVIPLALGGVVGGFEHRIDLSRHLDIPERLVMCSPVGLVFFTEFHDSDANSLAVFLVPGISYAALLIWLRRRCLSWADSYLGRLPELTEGGGEDL
ncbi:MAG: ABC transporter permease subunit [Lentisphaerae bacterium]|jgi:ABC-type transport system involved in multi-copper enzyme maturation permease subunit|nr:ABC transporter permease subunit [Lentisphaerota bacterium]MBT4815354.1 ABC transporter permease subunit [Lentisphaerota bacterium]MBT5608883.1 ABC transporter permease subunit [Lentisphaerota bacterium]MBT7057405.1 ABC transporter permease subunit [Lentisphaerota bacterium]MBT7842749.1 ABC transporter permease subunit [Lentisphaerota bacterium]